MNQFIPMNALLLESSLSLFARVSTLVTGFLAVVVAMRLCYLVVSIGALSDYSDILKDIITYLAVMSLFPMLMKALLVAIGSIAAKIPFSIDESVQTGAQGFVTQLFLDSPLFMVSGQIGHLIVFGFIQSIYSLLMSMFISAAPIFIFLSTVLKISMGLRGYFSVVTALSMWPVMYNLIGALGAQVSVHFSASPVQSFCFWLILQAMQLLSPIISFQFFKSMSGETGLGKALILKRMFS